MDVETTSNISDNVGDTSDKVDTEMPVGRYLDQAEKKNICNTCFRSFSIKKYLVRHLRTHLPKGNKYTCDVCYKAYSRKDALKRHLLIHTEERPHACYMCNEAFSRKDELDKHFRTHKTVGNHHTCYKCYKVFAREDSLKRHFRTHTGEKQQVCPKCDKRFFRRDELVKHFHTHKPPTVESEQQLSDDEFPIETNLKTLLIIHIKTRKPLRVAKQASEEKS